ncbi:MAG TPA: 30S ribosomal protein S16 [Dehalococcoidia bacterium]|jgi:small subunit ribosomal protein S16|nr:30S ribosomal protein S16 [Chloroflexota bacterium]MCH2317077.1 30S ribosomal protein S16 [SAR202 cluster bacterium]PCH91077.1 MAG: 30S ribosomal protein S16 [Dehalococcoidia bacterium]RUA05839.1 MAG: 30S ribosomal protein S16 [Candidatus Poseidoniales archaeon]HCH08646.1 30S ribosomal protein S16 [Dehalococcoidia bacterium]|tara:strand:+ start:677 stop:934 length:258 start_codon:yes stop_codon:yes gene_type:complete
MLKIRLRRTGARHQPSYRVVVADSRAARDGAFIDYLGHYNPRTDPPTISIDQEKVKKWIGVGAQPTDSVKQLLYTLSNSEKAESE